MKITDVRAHLLGIPIKEKEFPARWAWMNFNQIIVAIHTDEGIVGYGEAFGYGVPQATASVINQVLKPMLIGADPAQISALSDLMFRQTHIYGRYGITTFAISGVDIALWDILGKSAGLPLYRLLGGAQRNEVPVYASLVRYKDQGEIRAAAFHAKRAGYEAIKIHQRDVESVKTVREAVGGETRLMVDVNCPWSPEQALDMAQKFKPYNLAWFEEPIWPPEDFRSLARLRRLVPHSPYFGPGFLATAHLVAGSPIADSIEYLYVNLEASVFKHPLKFEKGYFHLPQGPGLGMEIDWEVVKQYEVT